MAKIPFKLIDIELTNRCPMRCVMCPRTHNMTREQGFMSFELFRKVVDEYVSVNPGVALKELTYLHQFGESLLHPEFGKFIRYAVSKGLRPAMSVNPIMMTPKVIVELLDAKPAELMVSMDGHDDESFFKIRGVKDGYETSKKNLLEFLKRKAATDSKIHVILSMIHFSLNKESIGRVKDFWENAAGVDAFLAKPFVTWNGDAQDVNRFSEEWRIGEEKRVGNDILRTKVGFVTCNNPWRDIGITWSGQVVSCCYDFDAKYPLGDANKQSLSDIWNGERMRALRKEFIDNKVNNPLCRNCSYLHS